MIKKFIKGSDDRGAEVIDALVKLGGINVNNYDGTNTEIFYYIYPLTNEIGRGYLDNRRSNSLNEVILNEWDEIKLPDPLTMEELNELAELNEMLFIIRSQVMMFRAKWESKERRQDICQMLTQVDKELAKIQRTACIPDANEGEEA